MLWANPRNPYVWIVLGVTLGFGMVGFYDDYLKVTKQTHAGISGPHAARRSKRVIAGAACFAIASLGRPPFATSLAFPFFKELVFDLGWFFVVFGAFIIVGAGNAVNLTDGLDGLAIGPVMIAALSFGVDRLSRRQRGLRRLSADPFRAGHRRARGAAAARCSAPASASSGSTRRRPRSSWATPARSRSAGCSARSRSPPSTRSCSRIIGGLFVLEAVSVIVQVVSFKLTGKRVFRMAPLHHHFEQKGWTEPQIVIRFWIISIVLALAGLSTLKLR